MNYIFYHIFLCDKIDLMVNEQLNRLIESNLLDSSELHVTILNNSNYTLKPETLELINKLSQNVSFENGNIYEIITHKKIYDHCKTFDGNYFYMHTKGCTRINDLTSGDYSYKNIENWRHMQEHFTIDRYKDCIDALQTHDIVGSNYMPQSNVLHVPAHYSGGFWWTTSEFIKKLPDPQTYLNTENVNRFHAEFWLGRINHKACCLYPIPKQTEVSYSQHRGFCYCHENEYKNNLIKNTFINKI